jgi:signal peptidase
MFQADSVTRAEHPPVPKRRTVLSVISSVVMNLLAVGGLACIVMVVLAMVFNVSLIMFKTGSMAPSIPAGSLAVVQKVPAASVEIGDVVTVKRPGQLPITHRVIKTSPGADGTTMLEMRGDANTFDDPGGYQVREVRKVLWSVPGLAKGVIWLSNPIVLLAITISAALLVLWAFWPRKSEDDVDTDHGVSDGRNAVPERGVRAPTLGSRSDSG